MQSLSHSRDQWYTSTLTRCNMHSHSRAHVHTRVVCECQGQSEGRRCADVLRELVWECPQCGNTFPICTHARTHTWMRVHTHHRYNWLEGERRKKHWWGPDDHPLLFSFFSFFTHSSPSSFLSFSLSVHCLTFLLCFVWLQVDCPLEVC